MALQLLLSSAFLAATVVAASLVRRRSAWFRLGLHLLGLILVTTALLPAVGSVLEPRFTPVPGSLWPLLAKLLVAADWLLLARVVILAGRIALGIDRRHRVARLTSDLAAAPVYVVAVLTVLDLVFGVSVAGLVATSGIIAIVLGLALQSTLADLFSGIALGIDRPFDIGDAIWIEGGIEGRVVELNWRSTRIETGTDDLATVPNSVVAKSRILNRSTPTERHGGTVRVVVDPAVLPRDAIALLGEAVAGTSHLSAGTETTIRCTELRGEGTAYEIAFSAPLGRYEEVRSDLLDRVARHMRHAGMALAPLDGSRLIRPPVPDMMERLRQTPILRPLNEAELGRLASEVVIHRGEAGRVLLDQGGGLSSLFVVARGTLGVNRDDGQGARRLGTLGPGDYFGELSLLAGSPNAATVSGLTRFEVYEVGKSALAPLLRDNPGLLRAFEEGAAEARAIFDRAAARACSEDSHGTPLLNRIKLFFGL